MSSYWTTFTYKNTPVDELHCTHKYLGELSKQELALVYVIIDNYFKNYPFPKLKPLFDKETWFGPEHDIRVLTTDEPIDNFLLGLKDRLDYFNIDSYGRYKPHTSTDTIDKVHKPFHSYSLLDSDRVLKEWK